MSEFPEVPLTIEGAAALHQMFRFKWRPWGRLDCFHQKRLLSDATAVLSPMEAGSAEGHPNQTALYSQIGHKGDLLLIHFRDTLEELNRAEIAIARTELAEYLEIQHSYLSVVELGLYESTAKTYQALADQGYPTHSPEWKLGIQDVLSRQRTAMAPRLFPRIPDAKYICFYPMDRRRGESKNWYTVPMGERQRMMHEHGLVGRRYADEVRQVITASIGLDDWEWGVDLFADDPLVFKRLIYEMRFDEVSAVYALFGTFYVGVRLPVANLSQMLLSAKG